MGCSSNLDATGTVFFFGVFGTAIVFFPDGIILVQYKGAEKFPKNVSGHCKFGMVQTPRSLGFQWKA